MFCLYEQPSVFLSHTNYFLSSTDFPKSQRLDEQSELVRM